MLNGFRTWQNNANAKNVNAIFGMTFVICGPFFYLTNITGKDMTSGNRQTAAIFLQLKQLKPREQKEYYREGRYESDG